MSSLLISDFFSPCLALSIIKIVDSINLPITFNTLYVWPSMYLKICTLAIRNRNLEDRTAPFLYKGRISRDLKFLARGKIFHPSKLFLFLFVFCALLSYSHFHTFDLFDFTVCNLPFWYFIYLPSTHQFGSRQIWNEMSQSLDG